MTVADPLYVVGIDLGTTNSAVSFASVSDDVSSDKQSIRRFDIPQLTGSGEFSRFSVLPSFLYLPGEYEISEEAIAHPWRMPSKQFAGKFARNFGAKIPQRLVASAKSWLCEASVNRQGPILPWGAPDEIGKVSPVEASAAYLGHIRQAWNRAQGDDEDRYLENQLVVVTVPASFDEVARELTLEAATLAGLTEVTLLEEPLATFYSWLTAHENDWSDHVLPDEQVLVCDVGGGTTDFTLIALRGDSDTSRFERVAVGDHLILGGDNIDLAIARHVENKLSQTLDIEKLKTLCHQCRQAKETILNGQSDQERLTLMGEGSSLITNTITATLTRDELEKIIIEQFFPTTITRDQLLQPRKTRVSEFGLSYETTSAVTLHLMDFLTHQQTSADKSGGINVCPDLILFNGGTLKPVLVQENIRKALQSFYKIDSTNMPRILDNPSHDGAVSVGAAYYGLVKSGHGVRVGSGSARSYYLAVSDATMDKHSDTGEKAVCVVERGVEEGTTISLKDHELEVIANQHVQFSLFSSSFRSDDHHGDMISIDDSLTSLPPLQTVVQFGDKAQQKRIPIQIEAQYTEIGSLVLWCRSKVSNHRWQLQFQLRELSPSLDLPETSNILETSVVDSALSMVTKAFSSTQSNAAAKKQLAGLIQEIADQVALPKEKWPVSFLRSLADTLTENKQWRTISADHEARWLNLTGFAMRPGIGDGYDNQRIKQLWKIYNQGMTFPNQARVRTEWWIFVRRLACGLKPGQQKQFLQDVIPVIMPRKGAKAKASPQEQIEIWMAVANMERLLVKDKVACGRALLDLLSSKKNKPQHVWTISRLGAREMLYGSADRVIPPAEATRWIDIILQIAWPRPKPVGRAVVQLARKTGDRTRDVEPETITKIADWFREQGLSEKDIKPIQSVVVLNKQEETSIFGESLPLGLVLKGT